MSTDKPTPITNINVYSEQAEGKVLKAKNGDYYGNEVRIVVFVSQPQNTENFTKNFDSSHEFSIHFCDCGYNSTINELKCTGINDNTYTFKKL